MINPAFITLTLLLAATPVAFTAARRRTPDPAWARSCERAAIFAWGSAFALIVFALTGADLPVVLL